MKTVFVRAFVMFAGVVLVVPFVAVALLVGARAVASAETAEHRLLLVAIALGGALFSGAKSLARTPGATRECATLRVASGREGGARHAFLNTPGY